MILIVFVRNIINKIILFIIYIMLKNFFLFFKIYLFIVLFKCGGLYFICFWIIVYLIL